MMDFISEADSKLALLYILGEFCEYIEATASILNHYTEALVENSENLVSVKNMLLTTCVKAFLKRPPEMQMILGRLFKHLLSNEFEDVDLKDRAAFYYRILQNNINDASLIVRKHSSIKDFLEDDEEIQVKQKLLLFWLIFYYKKIN